MSSRNYLTKGENPEIFDLTCLLMKEHEWDSLNDGYEAACLYVNLRCVVRSADLALDWNQNTTLKKRASLHHSDWSG